MTPLRDCQPANKPLRVQIVPAVLVIIGDIPRRAWDYFVYMNIIAFISWSPVAIFKCF